MTLSLDEAYIGLVGFGAELVDEQTRPSTFKLRCLPLDLLLAILGLLHHELGYHLVP